MLHQKSSSKHSCDWRETGLNMAPSFPTQKVLRSNDAERIQRSLSQVAALLIAGETWLLPIFERLEAELKHYDVLFSAIERAKLVLNDKIEPRTSSE